MALVGLCNASAVLLARPFAGRWVCAWIWGSPTRNVLAFANPFLGRLPHSQQPPPGNLGHAGDSGTRRVWHHSPSQTGVDAILHSRAGCCHCAGEEQRQKSEQGGTTCFFFKIFWTPGCFPAWLNPAGFPGLGAEWDNTSPRWFAAPTLAEEVAEASHEYLCILWSSGLIVCSLSRTLIADRSWDGIDELCFWQWLIKSPEDYR